MKKVIKDFVGYTTLFLMTCLPTIVSRLAPYQTNKVWYNSLAKPFFVPPSWIFAIVWPILYFFMATAAWIVWRKHHNFISKPLVWYYLQLAVNAVWVPLFFGAHLLFTSMIWTYILLGFVIITARAFFAVDKAAGTLLVPYVAWCGFASLMSTALWIMN